MSKRRVFLPLLEQFLIRLSIVAESAPFPKDTLRILVHATFSLVLLVHILSIAASHLAAQLPNRRHSLGLGLGFLAAAPAT